MHVLRSMRSKSARIFIAVGAVATIAACSGSTEAKPVASGRYELSQVNGANLPARYLVYGFGGQSFRHAISGSLRFISGGRLIDSRRLTDQPQGTEPFEFDYVDTASYEVEGDMLIIDRPGIPGQLAPYSDTAFVNGELLIMPVRTLEGIVPLVRTLTYLRPQ